MGLSAGAVWRECFAPDRSSLLVPDLGVSSHVDPRRALFPADPGRYRKEAGKGKKWNEHLPDETVGKDLSCRLSLGIPGLSCGQGLICDGKKGGLA